RALSCSCRYSTHPSTFISLSRSVGCLVGVGGLNSGSGVWLRVNRKSVPLLSGGSAEKRVLLRSCCPLPSVSLLVRSYPIVQLSPPEEPSGSQTTAPLTPSVPSLGFCWLFTVNSSVVPGAIVTGGFVAKVPSATATSFRRSATSVLFTTTTRLT